MGRWFVAHWQGVVMLFSTVVIFAALAVDGKWTTIAICAGAGAVVGLVQGWRQDRRQSGDL